MNKIAITFLALLCFCTIGRAQNVTITGTVTDLQDGAPVLASIMEQGTMNGTMARQLMK